LVAGAIVLAVGCAFRAGEIDSNGTDAGGGKTKSYGAQGIDERFTWTTDSVTDNKTALVWTRSALGTFSWNDASIACATHGMRLPTRDELLEISDWMNTDLFASPGWHWSSTAGSRSGTAWAVGLSGYSNANDASAKSLVRCVRSR
jgi:hypothetical protein